MFNNTDSRKISHREVFLEGTYRLSVKGAFLLQKPPLFQSKSWIKKFTRKGAFTDKEFRSLRRATKGSAFRIRHLLKKVDENFYFCTQTTRPCAVGEQCPSSSWLFTGRAKTAFAALGVRKLGNFLNLRQQNRHNHHLCHSVLWLNCVLHVRIIVQKYAHFAAVI